MHNDKTNYIDQVRQGKRECLDPRPNDPGVRVRQGIMSQMRTVKDTVSTATHQIGQSSDRRRFKWLRKLLGKDEQTTRLL